MKLTINTIKFQELLTKSIKGASNNKLIPLTSLMAIELKDEVLSLTTTDATNYLVVKESGIKGDYFYVVVEVETFSKLISRMTSDLITLELTDNYLNVTGNGTYKIELTLDEDGNLIKYPEPISAMDKNNVIGKIKQTTIKRILSSIKPALLTTMEMPCYTCYYVGDCVIGTDTYKISSLKEHIFDTPRLLSADLFNLLDVITDDEITVYADGNKLLFASPKCSVYGLETPGIENFCIDAINELIVKPFNSRCKLPRNAITQLLDRISLFVGAYDKGEITLTFTKEGLIVSSKMSTGTELIKYVESNNFVDFICKIDVIMLMSQIKAQASDIIEVYYGDDSAIKIVDGSVTSVVALLADD